MLAVLVAGAVMLAVGIGPQAAGSVQSHARQRCPAAITRQHDRQDHRALLRYHARGEIERCNLVGHGIFQEDEHRVPSRQPWPDKVTWPPACPASGTNCTVGAMAFVGIAVGRHVVFTARAVISSGRVLWVSGAALGSGVHLRPSVSEQVVADTHPLVVGQERVDLAHRDMIASHRRPQQPLAPDTQNLRRTRERKA